MYTFGAAALTIPTPVITHTVGCAMTYKLFAFFDVSNKWEDFSDATTPLSTFISSFVPATGVAQVTCTGTGTAPTTGLAWKAKTLIQMRIVATSTYSKKIDNAATDDF